MNAYRFRLEAVLRLRRSEEERARENLFRANVALRNSIERRDAELVRFNSIEIAYGTMSHEQFMAERLCAELVADSLQAARDAMGRAADAAVLAQLAWSEASRSVKALERLDEHRRLEHAEEARREEAIDVDSFVTAGYGRQLLATGNALR